MKILALILLLLPSGVNAQEAADTSGPSPFSVVIGSRCGVGALIGHKSDNSAYSYDLLQYDNRVYADGQLDVTLLWKEKFGMRAVCGRVGRRNSSGADFLDYLGTAYPLYTYSYEYSRLNTGYVYSFGGLQIVRRWGSEPFNLTVAAGAGFGRMDNASATVIMKETGSNNFSQLDYEAKHGSLFCVPVSAELGYMRQMGIHWFMNTGLSLTYTGVSNRVTYSYSEQEYGQSAPAITGSHEIETWMHHLSFGLFLNFQWNRKESPRAIYI